MKKKILVVEDNDDLRAILILRLTHMGYQAIEAKSSKEAIACAKSEQPALIFMDLGLPRSELWVAEASRVGIETYLLKPGSFQTLKKTIEKFTANGLPEECFFGANRVRQDSDSFSSCITALSCSIVGAVKSVARGMFLPVRVSISTINGIASRECPPKSNKLS